MQPRKLLSGAAFLLAIGVSSSAMATVFFAEGNDPLGGSNVLFNSGETSLGTGQILGDLNTGQTDAIRFTSSTDTLITSGSGQAAILSSTDFDPNPGNNTDQGGINQLSITAVDPFIGFEAIQLNLVGQGSTVTFTVFDQFGLDLTQTVTVGSGENRYTFTTDALQFITNLSFTSDAGVSVSLEGIRQVRVGDLVLVPGPLAGAGLPALLALGGFVWARRRQAGATAA